ncbi:MAG: large subunit ribosomal protein [Clostridia bacterium]|jgi:large subunit ribosomal protein L9|nr:large subunit ribosomal protein [Clostridia bacterium]MDN5322579.1 large subunit ribosomal protein [Clostridia bacterium]
MKVILQEDIKALGKKGDIIEVKEGYARNYLLPKKLAVEANESNVKELNRQKKIKADRAEKERQEAEKIAEKIKAITVNLKVKSGENGKLFGAVTTKDIAENLVKIHKLKIDKRKIELDENIKSIGEYDIKIKLHPMVHAQLKVKVLPE